jgi:hypothetical protein
MKLGLAPCLKCQGEKPERQYWLKGAELCDDLTFHLECPLGQEVFEKPRKGLYCSRSFGRPVTTFEDLGEALAIQCARGGEKLRRQRLAASYMTVLITTPRSRHSPEAAYSAASSYCRRRMFIRRLPRFCRDPYRQLFRI